MSDNDNKLKQDAPTLTKEDKVRIWDKIQTNLKERGIVLGGDKTSQGSQQNQEKQS